MIKDHFESDGQQNSIYVKIYVILRDNAILRIISQIKKLKTSNPSVQFPAFLVRAKKMEFLHSKLKNFNKDIVEEIQDLKID